MSSSSSGVKKKWGLSSLFKSAGNSPAAAAAHTLDGHANHRENHEKSVVNVTDNYKKDFTEVRDYLIKGGWWGWESDFD